jgi:trigger factor
MSMNVTVAEQDGLKRKLQVEVPLDEVRTTYDEVYHRLRTNIRVAGFRPGKYPRHLAEKRFQSVMAGEAMQTLVPKYFDQALSELSLKPATEPHFDNLEIDKAKPFRFEVAFEIVPSFDLLAPGDFKLKEQKAKVTAKDVDARIEVMRMARAALEDKDGPAAEGDVVLFDFEGTLDGAPFEGGSAQGQRLEVGAGQYLPDFDAQFPGVRAGESKGFEVTFPEDYGSEEIAGKTVRFEVQVQQVQQKVPPPLDEAFFKLFGEKVTSLKELQAEIKEQLEQEHERAAQQDYQNQLADRMRERYDFAVPEALVEQGLHEFEHQLSHDDPEALQDEQKLAERKAGERAKIEGNLRVAYAVDALAKEYGVQADTEEVRQRFFYQAYLLRQNPTELMQSPFGRRMLMQIEQSMVTAATLERLATEVLAGGKGTGGGKTGEEAAPKADAREKAAAAKTKADKPKEKAAAAKDKPDKPKAGAAKPGDKGAKSGPGKGSAGD